MSGAIPTLAGLAALAGLVLAVLGARILVLRHSGHRDTWLPPPSTDPPDPPPLPPEESDAKAPWDPDPPEERVVQIATQSPAGGPNDWLPELYALTLERHRLSLPQEISDFLPWYTPGESCDALAMPGPHGGVVVLSPEAKELRDRTLEQLEEEPSLMPEDLSSGEFAKALRYRTSWTVRIGPDKRLTLPADARAAGLIPSSPNARVAVAVVMGAIQVWGLDDLPSVLQTLAARKS